MILIMKNWEFRSKKSEFIFNEIEIITKNLFWNYFKIWLNLKKKNINWKNIVIEPINSYINDNIVLNDKRRDGKFKN